MKTPGESEVPPGLGALDLDQEQVIEFFCHAVGEGLWALDGNKYSI